MQAHVSIENHGSIVLIRPLTADAKRWIFENVSEDSQFFGDALVIEPRYVAHLLVGLEDAGLYD